MDLQLVDHRSQSCSKRICQKMGLKVSLLKERKGKQKWKIQIFLTSRSTVQPLS